MFDAKVQCPAVFVTVLLSFLLFLHFRLFVLLVKFRWLLEPRGYCVVFCFLLLFSAPVGGFAPLRVDTLEKRVIVINNRCLCKCTVSVSVQNRVKAM